MPRVLVLILLLLLSLLLEEGIFSSAANGFRCRCLSFLLQV